MGYTHYWTQRRDFTAVEWAQVTADLQAILKYVEHEQGVPLADGAGEARTRPVFAADEIAFNGLGDDSRETFVVYRKRPAKLPHQTTAGWNFCKTARKPYDLAVTACLAYLATVIEGAYEVSSDGTGSEWSDGLEAARRALPQLGNVLNIPPAVLAG